MTSTFPNLFIFNGPNTVAPWALLIRGVELEAAHAARLIRHIHHESTKSPSGTYRLVACPSAEKHWTDAMTKPLERLATSTRYGPWYYYSSKTGKNTFFFPFSQLWYAWKTAWVVGKEYVGSDGVDVA